MKLLVFAHRLEVGGTQVNAIELAAALRASHGHDVVLFATPGPMLELAKASRLRFIPAPDAQAHPSPARMLALRQAVRQEQPDLVHAWDWPQCLDALYGAHLLQRMPLAVTDMSMVLSRWLPKSVPTTFGTPELVDQARRQGRSPVELIVPPVDVRANAPGAADGAAFRTRHGIAPGEIALVTVSRLTEWMKAESLRRTIDAVRRLGRALPLRFVVVGDGTARPEIERVAAQANAALGRAAVIFTGALIDPRPAYAAADIVIGMGGSALRAMAFAKPVLIVGELGFSAPFDPSTANDFYYRGMYGLGNGDTGSARLAEDIRTLAERPDALPALGEFSRRFVVEHFALDTIARQLSDFLQTTASNGARLHRAAADGARTAAILMGRRLIPTAARRLLAG